MEDEHSDLVSVQSLRMSPSQESGIEERASVITSGSMLGTVKKWINFIHGWQPRRLLLTDSYIAYYKSEYDFIENIGGKILDLKHLHVIQHPVDTYRFDIMTRSDVNKCIWFLRSSSTEECRLWIDMIGRRQRAVDAVNCLGADDQSSLRCSGSTSLSRQPSLLSNGRSSCSNASFTRTHDLKVQTAQMETFQENLGQALTVVENFFTQYSTDLHDLCSPSYSHSHSEDGDHPNERMQTMVANIEATEVMNRLISSGKRPRHISETSESSDEVKDQFSDCTPQMEPELKPLSELKDDTFDFVGAACSFKTNADGYLASLNYCIDLIQQREKSWRRRIELEQERCREAEAFAAHAQSRLDAAEGASPRFVCMPTPDHEEGPDCTMEEEEFFDCVEVQLDLWEHKDEIRQAMLDKVAANNREQSKPTPASPVQERDPIFCKIRQEVEKVMTENINNIGTLENAAECGSANQSQKFKDSWSLLLNDGSISVYECIHSEEPGMVITPLLATGSVKGATARETTERFWDGAYRRDWEHTIDTPPFLIKRLDDNTVIYYQIYKRAWPTTQRFAIFWSSRVRVDKDRWLVMNKSIDRVHSLELLSRYQGTLLSEADGLVMVMLKVSLYSRSIFKNTAAASAVARSNLSCLVIYMGSINPGGWAPASVLKTIYRREYPRFVSLFTKYVARAFTGVAVHPTDVMETSSV